MFVAMPVLAAMTLGTSALGQTDSQPQNQPAPPGSTWVPWTRPGGTATGRVHMPGRPGSVAGRGYAVPAPTVTITRRPVVVSPGSDTPLVVLPEATTTTFVGASGISLDAKYRDSHWAIAFHAGPLVYPRYRGWNECGMLGFERRRWITPYLWRGYDGTLWTTGMAPAVGYTEGPADPRLAPGYTPLVVAPWALPVTTPDNQATPAPLTDFELAMNALAAEDAPLAVARLRRHLAAAPDDVRAMRLLGLELVESGKPADAAAVIRLAYRTDPGLAREAIDPDALKISDARMRKLVVRAVTAANQAKDASSWLVVSVLMQGEGRDDLAKVMLERARKLGLEDGVFAPLSAELGK